MSEKKTKLQVESEKVEMLVNLTNKKIVELGVHTNYLYNALVLIQSLFDKIRNVPTSTRNEYERIKQVRMNWKQQVEKIENDYNEATKSQMNKGLVVTSMGIGLAVLGPTAAMGVATTFGVASTGVSISALSGAAATNAALAWLGGGALAAGGGGMAAGETLLALAGPIGWAIAGMAFLTSGFLFWKLKSDKEKLENIFLLICKRDNASYSQAIVEMNERINRIVDETKKLESAIVDIVKFGTDYNEMTEDQKYTLGAYVNLMNASTQLLVNPILGLQPNFSDEDFNKFISVFYPCVDIRLYCESHKSIIIYMANLLYKIDIDESDRKLLAKSFMNNKEFIEKMRIDKKDINVEFFGVIDRILKYAYVNCKKV